MVKIDFNTTNTKTVCTINSMAGVVIIFLSDIKIISLLNKRLETKK